VRSSGRVLAPVDLERLAALTAEHDIEILGPPASLP
jgi:hypothetical protein